MIDLFIYLWLIFSITLVLSYKHKHKNEWHRHPQCNYCNSNTSINYNESLPNKYIVDVFLLLKINNEYQYIKDGIFWYVPKIIQSYNNNEYYSRIHMITNSIDIINYGILQGYYMYNMNFYSSLELNFYNIYVNKHNSFNHLDYEFLCFYRWILYKKIINDWNNNITDNNFKINRIISIDSDVLFYMNIAKFYYNIINSLFYNDYNYIYNNQSIELINKTYEYELIVVSRGAVQLFTSNGLITYANYIYNFYNRSIEIVGNITNATADLFYNFKVFSDMKMTELFCEDNKYKRNICYESISLSKYYTRTLEQNCLIERLGCLPLGNIFTVMTMKKYSLYYKDKNFYGQMDNYPYCFMHFQGDVAKQWFNFYARYQDRLLNIYYDKKRLLIQAATKAQVFYIDRYGNRRSFGSFDLFLAFNFTDDDIIKKLPIYLVDSLPLGEQLNYTNDYEVANNL